MVSIKFNRPKISAVPSYIANLLKVVQLDNFIPKIDFLHKAPPTQIALQSATVVNYPGFFGKTFTQP